MTRDEVVNGIAEKARHDASDGGETPRSAEIAGNPQACVRADEQVLSSFIGMLDPDHRVDRLQLRMALSYSPPGVAVERREAQSVLTLVAKNELDAGGTEPTGSVVEEKRRATA